MNYKISILSCITVFFVSQLCAMDPQQKAAAEAFVQASHGRLGATSPAGQLPLHLIKHIVYLSRIASWNSRPLADRNRALIRAVGNADEVNCEILLAAGADVNTTEPLENPQFENPRYVHEFPEMELYNQTGITDPLIMCEDPELRTIQCERTPLHLALYAPNRFHLIPMLLNAGANVNAFFPARRYRDNLIVATRFEGLCTPFSMSRQLLPDNLNGETPLIQATRANLPAVVKRLIESGADINTQNDHGQTALHIAAWGNHSKIARTLLEHNANPNIQTSTNGTFNCWEPLHIAACFNSIDIAQALVSAGAHLETIVDPVNDSDFALNGIDAATVKAYDIAQFKGNQEICEIIQRQRNYNQTGPNKRRRLK